MGCKPDEIDLSLSLVPFTTNFAVFILFYFFFTKNEMKEIHTHNKNDDM